MIRSAIRLASAVTAMVASIATAADGDSHTARPTPDEVVRILDVLAGMRCEIAPNDIERRGGGFALHDVHCADGRYEIVLGPDLNVTGRRQQ